MSNTALQHFGVLGMRWGIRRGEKKTSTQKMAEKDAQRYIDAKMFYGKTAGTKRKLLKAELDKKKKSIAGYEDAFNEHLNKVDSAKSAKKAVSDRNRIDTSDKARRLLKNILGVTGSLTVAAGTALYYANKQKVDGFIMGQLARIANGRVYF